MSWHFSQALVEGYLVDPSSGGARSAVWKSIPTAPDDSCSAKMKDTCHHSPFGTMFVPSTDALGQALLMSFRRGSPAKTSAPQGRGEVYPALSQGCGAKLQGSLERLAPHMSCLKTLSTSVTADWTECSETLPSWGMMRNGVLYRRKPQVPPTSARGCGSPHPTPTTRGNELSPSMSRWAAHRALAELARATGHSGGPWITWREWVMGWPIGWTAPEPLDRDRYHQWFDWHGSR